MMRWFFFILFMVWTLALVWNGKDLFNKKQWILTGGGAFWCCWRLSLLDFC